MVYTDLTLPYYEDYDFLKVLQLPGQLQLLSNYLPQRQSRDCFHDSYVFECWNETKDSIVFFGLTSTDVSKRHRERLAFPKGNIVVYANNLIWVSRMRITEMLTGLEQRSEPSLFNELAAMPPNLNVLCLKTTDFIPRDSLRQEALGAYGFFKQIR